MARTQSRRKSVPREAGEVGTRSRRSRGSSCGLRCGYKSKSIFPSGVGGVGRKHGWR